VRLWSLEDLAQQVGVSRQAISQYELGLSLPSQEVLSRLSQILNRPLAFFAWPTSAEGDGTSITYFRKQRRTSVRHSGAVQVYITWLYDMAAQVQRWVEFPPVTVRPFSVDERPMTEENIEAAASQARLAMHLGSGPISHVTRLLEHYGFVIAHWSFSQAPIDGGSRWVHGRPVVVLGREGGSLARQRFGLAHELGHLLLHAGLSEKEYQKHYSAIEQEANDFAAAFLMPRESFGAECLIPSLSFLQRLKSRWKISIQAMIQRAGTLGIFSPEDVERLYRQLSAKGWRRKEPGDETEPLEEPALFVQALDLLQPTIPNIFSTLREDIPLSIEELSALTHIPKERWERASLRVVRR